jgi:tRNA(His) 5'-end guanylyltransferase
VRVDGRGFSRYTAGFQRPFDARLAADMQATAVFLAEQVEGAVLAYVQSDEISVVLAPCQDHWYGGQVQKIASITAALATLPVQPRCWCWGWGLRGGGGPGGRDAADERRRRLR